MAGCSLKKFSALVLVTYIWVLCDVVQALPPRVNPNRNNPNNPNRNYKSILVGKCFNECVKLLGTCGQCGTEIHYCTNSGDCLNIVSKQCFVCIGTATTQCVDCAYRLYECVLTCQNAAGKK